MNTYKIINVNFKHPYCNKQTFFSLKVEEQFVSLSFNSCYKCSGQYNC